MYTSKFIISNLHICKSINATNFNKSDLNLGVDLNKLNETVFSHKPTRIIELPSINITNFSKYWKTW